jgi:hypothetical protein
MRLRLPYPQARFKHADELPWQEVLAQDHSGVRKIAAEKWMDYTPRCLAFLGKWDPGMVVAQHGHMSTNTIYIIEGSITSGGIECTPGMNITLDIGTPYGPNITGPEGVLLYEVMAGSGAVWYADPEGFAQLKRERGIRQLPNAHIPEYKGTGPGRASYDETGMLVGPIAARPSQPYETPRFCDSKALEWREVLAQAQNGKRISAWEKWLDFSPEVMCAETRLDPGMIIPARGRNCLQTILVLEGSMTVDGRECTKGMHLFLEVGTPMGTVVAGPQGVKLYEVRMGNPVSWYVHDDPFGALDVDRGVTPLPAPPLDLPAWMGERRPIYS